MRILYLPIIEPGAHHDTALRNKRGLLDALRGRGDVVQVDYLELHAVGKLYEHIENILLHWPPDLLISQLHGADIFTVEQIRSLRRLAPAMQWVNWAGDSWPHSLVAQPILDMAREFDVQLVVTPDTIPLYQENGVNAAFWQIGYEAPIGDLPDVPAHDVVFLGNATSPQRKALLEILRALPYKVGIYGDWEQADGNCTYDFAYGEALYKKAKLAIADVAYPEHGNAISNRGLQIAGAGGAVMLHQSVDRMPELTHGWINTVHYVEWHTFDELPAIIDLALNPRYAPTIHKIAKYAQNHVFTHHTYEHRVAQLFDEIMPTVERLRGVV